MILLFLVRPWITFYRPTAESIIKGGVVRVTRGFRFGLGNLARPGCRAAPNLGG